MQPPLKKFVIDDTVDTSAEQSKMFKQNSDESRLAEVTESIFTFQEDEEDDDDAHAQWHSSYIAEEELFLEHTPNLPFPTTSPTTQNEGKGGSI